MSDTKACAVGALGALALLGASLGVAPAVEAQVAPQGQPPSVETNQKKVKTVGGRVPGWLNRAGAVVDAARNPSFEGAARALGAVAGSEASTQGGGAAQGGLAALKLDAGAMSIAEGGILRCENGQEVTLGLIGEDASMQRAPLEPLRPKAHSTDDRVVRAAMSSGSDYVVNVRCGGDGEAWVVADAGGQRAVYPVLVGKSRRQPAMTTQAPIGGPGAAAMAAPQGASGPSLQQAGRAADTARSIFNAIRR
jgi:hypothetical protein